MCLKGAEEGSTAPPGAKGETGEKLQPEGEEESGVNREFKDPLCALVQNCTVLHNIVGPACIFLKHGLSMSQIVRTHTARTQSHTHTRTLMYTRIHVLFLSPEGMKARTYITHTLAHTHTCDSGVSHTSLAIHTLTSLWRHLIFTT